MAPKWASGPYDLSRRVKSCRSHVDEPRLGSDDDGSRLPTTMGMRSWYRIAMETEAIPNVRFQFHDIDVAVHRHTFARDVAVGLTAPQKWLPPKYFYDERGSQLYEQICALPEYYLYRAELEIFRTYAAEIHAEIGHLALVEFGSGNARKTRYLLRAYEWAGQPFRYCPVDISRENLMGHGQPTAAGI